MTLMLHWSVTVRFEGGVRRETSAVPSLTVTLPSQLQRVGNGTERYGGEDDHGPVRVACYVVRHVGNGFVKPLPSEVVAWPQR